jgi:hypothetical protein
LSQDRHKRELRVGVCARLDGKLCACQSACVCVWQTTCGFERRCARQFHVPC